MRVEELVSEPQSRPLADSVPGEKEEPPPELSPQLKPRKQIPLARGRGSKQ